jgi:hypothetical protein
MNKKDIKDHKEVAKNMSWCELASIIIDLEYEKHELKHFMSEKQIEKYEKIIKIYQEEKQKKLDETQDWHKEKQKNELKQRLEYGNDFFASWGFSEFDWYDLF